MPFFIPILFEFGQLSIDYHPLCLCQRFRLWILISPFSMFTTFRIESRESSICPINFPLYFWIFFWLIELFAFLQVFFTDKIHLSLTEILIKFDFIKGFVTRKWNLPTFLFFSLQLKNRTFKVRPKFHFWISLTF